MRLREAFCNSAGQQGIQGKEVPLTPSMRLKPPSSPCKRQGER